MSPLRLEVTILPVVDFEQQLAIEEASGVALRDSAKELAKEYPNQVKDIQDLVDALNIAFPDLNLRVTIPALEKYVHLAGAGDYPGLPPGVG
ncbi:MAG: hypothetical protein MUF18_08195 [Fimbriiglobus sp.]|nr:hypothetical protein [Fimbriiglobus sp.]